MSQPSEKILIAGGSGLIGTALTSYLLEKGYDVSLLSRSKKTGSKIRTFLWEPENEYIEKGALDDIDVIINLAGANVAGKAWSPEYKMEIMQSRTDAANTLYLHVKRSRGKIRKIINASAVGYYPDSNLLMTEDSPAGINFLSKVVQNWEWAAQKFDKIDLPVCIFRFGIVLSDKGGFLPEIAKPIKFFAGAILGDGKQNMAWIHISDLCRMISLAMENENIRGIYNAVAPETVTNAGITKLTARKMGRFIWLPKVPEFALRLLFGEFSQELLANHRVSSNKIEKAGFTFLFPDIESALNDLVKK